MDSIFSWLFGQHVPRKNYKSEVEHFLVCLCLFNSTSLIVAKLPHAFEGESQNARFTSFLPSREIWLFLTLNLKDYQLLDIWFMWESGSRVSKLARLTLLLSSSFGLSDTVKLQQVLPCPASSLGMLCLFWHFLLFSLFRLISNVMWSSKHESNERQCGEHRS